MLTSGNATGGGTVPQYLTAVGGTVYFSGFDLTNHEQLWSSGGTAATTGRLTSGNASQGGVNPQMLTAAGNSVYYSANDGCTGEVVVDDGDDAGCGGDADVGQRVGWRREPDEPGRGGQHGVLLRQRRGAQRAAVVEQRDDRRDGDGGGYRRVGDGERGEPDERQRDAVLHGVHAERGLPGLAEQRDGERDGGGHQPEHGRFDGAVGADGRVEQPLLHGAGRDAVGVAGDDDDADADAHAHAHAHAADVELAVAGEHRLRDGADLGAARRDGQRARDLQLQPGGGYGAGRRHRHAVGDLHPHGHGGLHHGDGDDDDRGGAGHAGGRLEQPGEHRLRDGAVVGAARRDGERAGDVHLHAGRRHRTGRRQ